MGFLYVVSVAIFILTSLAFVALAINETLLTTAEQHKENRKVYAILGIDYDLRFFNYKMGIVFLAWVASGTVTFW